MSDAIRTTHYDAQGKSSVQRCGGFTVAPFAARMGDVKLPLRWWLRFSLLLCLPASLHAGGSGLNVVVVVNQNKTNSLELGNYYCEKRQVPPQNLLRINWSGESVIWTKTEFESTLAGPLRAALANRRLTNQIDLVLLSMDIPYKVANAASGVGNDFNSTTSTLFYGFKDNPSDPEVSCTLPDESSNPYAGSEDIFRNVAPGTSSTNFLAMMLTSTTLAQAKLVVDRAVASDSSFPTQTVYLSKSDDAARNIRYQLFDNAIFNTRLRDNYAMARTNSIWQPPPLLPSNMLGYQDGLYQFLINPDSLVLGALADSLTSYGGKILEPTDHTTLLAFINAGAVGSYGTVVEPCAYLVKFPSPQNYFYQSRGFNVVEGYYQSITNPYQGVLVGEPLAAPFAHPASGSWNNLPVNALLSGTTNLSVQFIAADAKHPVQRMDLFLDGLFIQTVTNLPPRQNNVLYVTLPGRTNMSYTVPSGATIKSVAADVTSVLNNAANKNFTGVNAFAHGDRIELQSFDATRTGEQTFLIVSNHIGTAAALTTFIHAARTNFLDSIAWGIRPFSISGIVVPGVFFNLTVTKTNGTQVTVGVTNSSSNATLPEFIQQFMNAINATALLQDAEGLSAEDLTQENSMSWKFNLRARNRGFDAAQIQVLVTGSFAITPPGMQKLDGNLTDLQPRNHLYVTAGATNLNFNFPFNTTTQADGFHEVTAVVYEGSHVRTQKRVSQNVRIQNTPLGATFTSLVGGTNTAIEATLQFSVVANTNTISRIELFSTGGLLATTNQASATFSVMGTNIGVGLHPFYAVVTRDDGKQYRTETKWIRLVGAEAPFLLSITTPPPTIAWPASAGRRYDVLGTTNISDAFLLRDTVVPSNSVGQWTETKVDSPQRFYRVRVSP
jgi:uncharacterized protein (TIGR03790 family)